MKAVLARPQKRKSTPATVLIISQDTRMTRLVRNLLESDGYLVEAAGKGDLPSILDGAFRPDILVLDFRNSRDAGSLCQQIRNDTQIPIIVMVQQEDKDGGIDSLDAGADDFIVKPFIPRELSARVLAVLRRCRPRDTCPYTLFRAGDLAIDLVRKRVTVGNSEVVLAPIEYKILSCLAQNAGAIVTPQHLMEDIWGRAEREKSHVLQANISRLRKKLQDGRNGTRYIRTRHGMGYVMVGMT